MANNFVFNIIHDIIYAEDSYENSNKNLYNSIMLGISVGLYQIILNLTIVIYVIPAIEKFTGVYIYNLQQDKREEDKFKEDNKCMDVLLDIGFIGFAIVLPIIEELIFRLCVHESIRFILSIVSLYYIIPEAYATYIFLVGIPKFLFAAAHLSNMKHFSFKPICVQFILLLFVSNYDYVYEYAGLLPCILSHMINNGIIYLI